MKILVDISDTLYDRIINAKSVPDLMGADIVNAIEAIKSGKKVSGDLAHRKGIRNG